MQRVSRTTPPVAGFAAFGAGVLLVLACGSPRPDSTTVQPLASAVQSAEPGPELPNPDDLRVNSDTMVQRAALNTYGSRLPSDAGHPARLWFLFNRDWSVREHGEGPEGLVEAKGWRDDPSWKNSKGPVYTVRESVEKRFAITINDSRVVSHYGGSRAVFGADTAWVFYARFAQ